MILMYGAPPGKRRPDWFSRIDTDEAKAASQVAKLRLRKVELERRITAGEAARAELELVVRMLAAADEKET